LIVVDTSVLVAILRQEPEHSDLLTRLSSADDFVIGAPTKFELLLVVGRWKAEDGIEKARRLLTYCDIRTIDWTDTLADVAATAFLNYGKGRHRAALNCGDCMAYALAKSLRVPLLFKGDDFRQTDIRSAL
jgi:ribonuclease VapC